MKTRIFRFLVVLALVLSALGASVSSVLADPPFKWDWDPYTWTDTNTTLCGFPIDVITQGTTTEIDFFDASGNYTGSNLQVGMQDTISANGKTLVGMPYHFNVQWRFDANGNMTRNVTIGVNEKIPLPDGKLFVIAGMVNWFYHPEENWVWQPDHGAQDNLAALCAALE